MSDATHFGKKEAFVRYLVHMYLPLSVLAAARAIVDANGSIYDLDITDECTPAIYFMSIGGNIGKKDAENAAGVFQSLNSAPFQASELLSRMTFAALDGAAQGEPGALAKLGVTKGLLNESHHIAPVWDDYHALAVIVKGGELAAVAGDQNGCGRDLPWANSL